MKTILIFLTCGVALLAPIISLFYFFDFAYTACFATSADITSNYTSAAIITLILSVVLGIGAALVIAFFADCLE